MVTIGAEWDLTGYIFTSTIDGIIRSKTIIGENEYEMQLCYLEPIFQKFSLRINDEMNPGFDYLSRFEEMERVMKLNSNSTRELKLKEENKKLKERIISLENEMDMIRKALKDVEIIEKRIIFDGV